MCFASGLQLLVAIELKISRQISLLYSKTSTKFAWRFQEKRVSKVVLYVEVKLDYFFIKLKGNF